MSAARRVSIALGVIAFLLQSVPQSAAADATATDVIEIALGRRAMLFERIHIVAKAYTLMLSEDQHEKFRASFLDDSRRRGDGGPLPALGFEELIVSAANIELWKLGEKWYMVTELDREFHDRVNDRIKAESLEEGLPGNIPIRPATRFELSTDGTVSRYTSDVQEHVDVRGARFALKQLDYRQFDLTLMDLSPALDEAGMFRVISHESGEVQLLRDYGASPAIVSYVFDLSRDGVPVSMSLHESTLEDAPLIEFLYLAESDPATGIVKVRESLESRREEGHVRVVYTSIGQWNEDVSEADVEGVRGEGDFIEFDHRFGGAAAEIIGDSSRPLNLEKPAPGGQDPDRRASIPWILLINVFAVCAVVGCACIVRWRRHRGR